MQYENIINDVNEIVQRFLDDNATKYTAEQVSNKASLFDPRSFTGPVWVSEDFIAVRLVTSRSLDYYGGFEYVEERMVLGNFVVYSADDQRVLDLIDQLNDGDDTDDS